MGMWDLIRQEFSSAASRERGAQMEVGWDAASVLGKSKAGGGSGAPHWPSVPSAER